jgi:antitoxin (DNA-binding transcriptional repressor) of toxin-antitoxin stability system
MNVPINAKRLRATLPDVVERVRKGTRFTVIYRSRPAFQIVPVDDEGRVSISLSDDPLYRAQPVGSSQDGRTSVDHDAILYRR